VLDEPFRRPGCLSAPHLQQLADVPAATGPVRAAACCDHDLGRPTGSAMGSLVIDHGRVWPRAAAAGCLSKARVAGRLARLSGARTSHACSRCTRGRLSALF